MNNLESIGEFLNESAKKIRARPSNMDLRLHALSLEIAAVYRAFHEDDGATYQRELCDDMLTAFRCIRRAISVNPSSEKRWGSHAAYNAMQGLTE